MNTVKFSANDESGCTSCNLDAAATAETIRKSLGVTEGFVTKSVAQYHQTWWGHEVGTLHLFVSGSGVVAVMGDDHGWMEEILDETEYTKLS